VTKLFLNMPKPRLWLRAAVQRVVRLRVGDIDREQKIIRIVQSKGRKDRYVMLPAAVLVLLRQWWKARPSADDAALPRSSAGCFQVAVIIGTDHASVRPAVQGGR